MHLEVRPAAAADIEETALWYASKRSGLGSEFLEELQYMKASIAESPRRRSDELGHKVTIGTQPQKSCVPILRYDVTTGTQHRRMMKRLETGLSAYLY